MHHRGLGLAEERTVVEFPSPNGVRLYLYNYPIIRGAGCFRDDFRGQGT